MMPRMGDHYLQMTHFHDDSLKEALKLKMLNQEDTFKKQVQELHRLYEIQMMLMKNLEFKGVGTKKSVNCSSQCILQRPSDAKLSFSGRVKHIDPHFLKKGDGWGTRENPVQVEYYCLDDTESSLDEVKLSLSIGGYTNKKRSGRKIGHENLSSVWSQEIIDLEKPSHTGVSKDIEPIPPFGWTASSAEPGNLQGYESNCIFVNGTNKDMANGTKKPESLVDKSKTFLEQNSLNYQGVTKWSGDLPGVGISPVTQVFTSHEVVLSLDLNEPLLDESLLDSKDLAMDSSIGACSVVTERVAGDVHNDLSPEGTSWNCSNEVSAIIQQATPNSLAVASNSTNGSTNTRVGEALSPDLESRLRSPSDCCESHGQLSWNSQHKDAELGSNFSGRNDESPTSVGKEEGDKDAVFSNLSCRADPVGDIDSSPASCKSDYATLEHTCSLKTVESGIYLAKPDISRINSSPDSGSSQNESSPDESKYGSISEKKEGSASNDTLVQRGAVSLMYLFLESSRRGEQNGCITEFDKANEIGNGKKREDQPQCSIDTYESMVLKLQESNVEDYCVTSNPVEVISTGSKEHGVKWRRGRRMKDFQKDILPSMASLSRHEISEDIRIMEGVIRSREYKRLRSKMSSAQNWFTPVKSRRSRLNYVGRKYYS